MTLRDIPFIMAILHIAGCPKDEAMGFQIMLV